jgi:hypothetical protein
MAERSGANGVKLKCALMAGPDAFLRHPKGFVWKLVF